MSFDMYCLGRKEAIEHHEEGIFEYINENEAYPELFKVWEAFYEGSIIDPECSNRIVLELIALREELSEQDRKAYSRLVDRLQSFFCFSYVEKASIRCVSD